MFQKNVFHFQNYYLFIFLFSFLFLNLGISISYIFIFLFFIYNIVNKKLSVSTENKYFFLILFYFIFISLFQLPNEKFNLNFLLKQLLIFKFFLLFWYLSTQIKNFQKVNSSVKLVFYFIIFLIVEVYLQRFFNFEIFGNEIVYGRVLGPYKQMVIGSIILYVGFYGFFHFLVTSKFKKNTHNLFFFIFLFNFYFFSIFCTGERMNFLLCLLAIFLMFLFMKKFRLKIIISSLLMFLLILLTLNKNESLGTKYSNFSRILNLPLIKIFQSEQNYQLKQNNKTKQTQNNKT